MIRAERCRIEGSISKIVKDQAGCDPKFRPRIKKKKKPPRDELARILQSVSSKSYRLVKNLFNVCFFFFVVVATCSQVFSRIFQILKIQSLFKCNHFILERNLINLAFAFTCFRLHYKDRLSTCKTE